MKSGGTEKKIYDRLMNLPLIGTATQTVANNETDSNEVLGARGLNVDILSGTSMSDGGDYVLRDGIPNASSSKKFGFGFLISYY